MLLKASMMMKVSGTNPQEPVYLGTAPNLVLIAPANIAFTLNLNVFNAQVLPLLGTNATVETVGLDCGNGQILPLDTANNNFQ